MPEVEATASGDQPAIPTSTKVHSPTTPPPTTPPPTTHTFSGIGGSITVRQNGDQLTVVATKPAAGFHAGRDGGSRTRVEVTFTSDSHQTQITVKLEGGAIKPAVTEKSENHDTSPHQTTVPDSSGGDPGGDGTNG